MIKKLIEKIFGRFCKCEEKTKTTSELLREGFDEEQETLKLEESVVEKIEPNMEKSKEEVKQVVGITEK